MNPVTRNLPWTSIAHIETAEWIDLGVSIADASAPEMVTAGGNLRIHFAQWNSEPAQVLFVDAVAHRWEQMEMEPLLEGEGFDSSHIIHQSKWLQAHLDRREFGPEVGYKHYRLNFNAAGCLQVIARDLVLECPGGAGAAISSLRPENVDGGLENPPSSVRSGDPPS
jgi:hypothetical protein